MMLIGTTTPAPCVVRRSGAASCSDGGMGLCGGAGATGLEGSMHLHDLSEHCLWRGRSLPHHPWLQHQAEAAAAGTSPEKEMQALGTHLAEGDGMGTGGLKLHRNTHHVTADHITATTLST